jgi:hypothetical protein
MKITSPSFLGGLVLASFLSLTTLALAGEPITGVDVKLGKNPGGALVARGQTDAKGQVTFANLAPGDYVVSYVELLPALDRVGHAGSAPNPTQHKAPISTSRSNKKHSNALVAFVDGHAKSAQTEVAHRTEWTNDDKQANLTFTVPAGPSRTVLIALLLPAVQQAREK